MQPEIQERAWKELDIAVGPERLPAFEDYDALPYIQAIIMECSRWLPVVPMGAPHSSTRADSYKGYFIPEGTTIITVSTTDLIDTLTTTLTKNRTRTECVVCINSHLTR